MRAYPKITGCPSTIKIDIAAKRRKILKKYNLH